MSKARAIGLATAYVLGMAVLYTGLGIAVATAGGAFGAWLGNPWVVFPIAGVMIALAASMFGAFDLQLPTSVQTRLGTVGGANPVGAFVMGLVSGLLSAPCTGPVLLGLLAFIAKSSAEGGSVLYGGSLLFVYALGMGTLFFAVALGASLFRPGGWMENVKSVFGIAMLVMAAWFLRPISPALEGFVVNPEWGLWLGLGLVAVGIAAGAVKLSFHGSTRERARKAVAVAVATVGGVLALNNVLYVPPMNWTTVSDANGLKAAVAEAGDRPLIIDFAATWCLPCKEMELQVFHDESVEPILAAEFDLVKVDVTEGTDEQEAIKAAFNSGTLPSVVIYGGGHGLAGLLPADAGSFEMLELPTPAAKISTLVTPEAFLEKLAPARQ